MTIGIWQVKDANGFLGFIKAKLTRTEQNRISIQISKLNA